MKRKLIYLLLAVAAYGGFLAATFPAERAFALIQSQSSVRVSGLSGTAWSGRATTLQVQGQTFQRFKWQFKPLSLLLAQLEFRLSFDGGGRSGQADVGLQADGGLRLTNVRARLPLADIDQLLGLGPFELTGVIDAQLDELIVLSAKPQSAEGKILWQGAGISSPMAQTFGEFEAQLISTEEGIKMMLKDSGGPLQLDGVVDLSREGVYQFTGHLSVRDSGQKMLVQGVQTLGVREPDGRIRVDYSGQL